MGNKTSCTFCKTCLVSTCMAKQRNHKVLKVVKSDGKIITSTSPILVKDVVARLSGSGVGLSKEANSENLPLDYELKIGEVYYELPCVTSVESSSLVNTTMVDDQSSGVKRVKIVITKQQLKELLAKQISVEEVLLGLEREASSITTAGAAASVDRSSANWKSNLESIPEEIE